MMQWLADVTKTGREKDFRTAAQISELSDGRALCELINVLHDACLPRRDRIQIRNVGMKLMNLSAFVESAKALGVDERDCCAPPQCLSAATRQQPGAACGMRQYFPRGGPARLSRALTGLTPPATARASEEASPESHSKAF